MRFLEAQAARDRERDEREEARKREREEAERAREAERERSMRALVEALAQSRCGSRSEFGAEENADAVVKCDLPEAKFSGGKGDVHPVDFMRRVEDHFRGHGVPPNQALDRVRDCFQGAAEAWMTFNRVRFASWGEFRDAFLAEFWSSEKQDELMNDVFRGSYRREQGGMKAYVYDLAAKASYLDPPLEESVVVRALKRHFPNSVRQILAGSRASLRSVRELADALEEMESAGGGGQGSAASGSNSGGGGAGPWQGGGGKPHGDGRGHGFASQGGGDRRGGGYHFGRNSGPAGGSNRNWRDGQSGSGQGQGGGPRNGPRVNAVSVNEEEAPPQNEVQEEEEVDASEN